VAHRYKINNSIRVYAEFTTDGEPADPSAVTLKIITPAGVVTTYTYPADITKESTGVYYKEIPSDQSGDWHYKWTGTGAVPASDEDYYLIEHSKFS
jgi:hypothetical protein